MGGLYSHYADCPERQLIEHCQPNGCAAPSWSRLTDSHNANGEESGPEGKIECADHRQGERSCHQRRRHGPSRNAPDEVSSTDEDIQDRKEPP